MEIKYSDSGKLVILPIKADWGPGKILKIESGYAYILFRDCGDKMPKKYAINDNPLLWSPVQSDAMLDELTLNPGKKKRRPTPAPQRIDFHHSLELFKSRYPQLFTDPVYRGGPQEGGHYIIENLSRAFQSSFGDGQLHRMVENGSVRVIVERSLLILRDQDLIYRTELKSFKDLLKDEAQTLAVFKALANVLESKAIIHDSMNPYFEVVKGVTVPGFAKWPNATLFPFLAQPERHMFLKPQVAKNFAAMLGEILLYEPQPNWRTYLTLLEMSEKYLGLLKPYGAHDYLDVETYFSVVCESVHQEAAV